MENPIDNLKEDEDINLSLEKDDTITLRCDKECCQLMSDNHYCTALIDNIECAIQDCPQEKEYCQPDEYCKTYKK